ncbi:Transcriptional regulatory protein, C terminal [Pseudonocardia thermophila]|uniref:Transcriptional regulatory protein, C terminal n=1 Tax=Pseudonocardia thermophila TaxID=1848 RepID=A0A1M6YH99_PSETH|nr:AAA family ATPase [Pseudonocardia thermophila]SHL17500.1 Transcriptional regulatory protein, C terminal [Pseudonocardia thermophila]
MSPPLRLRVLGPFGVDGEPGAPVPAGQARRVLAVLAWRRGEFVTVEELVDALWEGNPPDRADRNIASIVSRLRRAFGPDLIEGSAAGYRLPADRAAVDLHDAAELVETAERELGHGRYALAATGAEQAAKLLDADLALAGEHDDRWVRDLRAQVADLLRRARAVWSSAALQMGAYDTAVAVASAALQVDPFDEDSTRTVMLAHQRAGRPGGALRAYRALREALAEHLGIDPSPATEALHLAVLRAEDPGTDRAGSTAEDSGIVGRDGELAVLRRSWDTAAAGQPTVALVTGEAGIGKSALVAALAEETRRTGALVVQATCFAAERSLYLQPVADLVRALLRHMTPDDVREYAGTRLGTLVELVPELTDVVGTVPYARSAPEVEHRRSLDAVSSLVTRIGARRPVLLVVEDVQHAGQATVEALHVLAGHRQGSRTMLVLTERTGEGRPPVVTALRDLAVRIDLGPLRREDVLRLAAHTAWAEDPDRLWSWTGGSPLFLTELLRLPVGTGPPVVPETLHEVVETRIDAAGDAVAHLLSQGAVLGTTFSLEDVAALSGLGVEDCAARADRALRLGLLTAVGENFRFANDIVRLVAYESAPEPVRINRHRRAARILHDRPEAAAEHLMAAGDPRGAADCWLRAAQAASLKFSHIDAERLLDRAVAAAEQGGDSAQLITAHLLRGQARRDLGRIDDARADHETALALARDVGDVEQEARALEQLGWTAFYARDALVAVEFAEQASHLAESAAAAPGALPSATLLVGRVRHWDGDYEGAATAYGQVLARTAPDGTTAVALAYQGALLQHQDRFAEARAVLARATLLCRRTGEFRPLLQALFFTALARGDSGDFAGALRALESARKLIDAENLGFYRAGIETTSSWIWQELGQVDRARAHALQAVELARRGGGALELEQELHALLAVADCDLMQGRVDDAGSLVERAVPMLDRSLPFRPRAVLRLVEMQARFDAGQAERLLDLARTHSSPKYIALALRHLGRHEEAAGIAAATGSDLLVAQLGAPADRAGALRRIAATLTAEQRATFVTAGRLHRPPPLTR